ncbi:MAG: pyridoxamine 5'-phosphate oxidase [Oscillochloris sp.]|nr:pyridoxamine 5'-phosphate oxidase [Oscillochloris sp.]
MPTKQGDLALLRDPVAITLLESINMVRLSYTWVDGSPRVVPIWFAWDGTNIIVWSPPTAPKLKALAQDNRVAVTIDSNPWPVKVLMVRGTADVQMGPVDAPAYCAMTERYLGAEASQGWIAQYSQMFPQTAQITIHPTWVGIIDMETRFPSAIEQALAGA